jgi:hypothetical protein
MRTLPLFLTTPQLCQWGISVHESAFSRPPVNKSIFTAPLRSALQK